MNTTTLNLTLDEKLVDPNDPVMIEREIMKFKPGLSQNYISRWMQITKKAFRYYRNYYHSASGFAKPLVAIPFSSIQDVKRVDLKTFSYNQCETVLNKY